MHLCRIKASFVIRIVEIRCNSIKSNIDNALKSKSKEDNKIRLEKSSLTIINSAPY